MATEVELFEFMDLPGRESVRGYVDSNGKANVSLGGVQMPRFTTDASGNITGLAGPGGSAAFRAESSSNFAIIGDSISGYNFGAVTVTSASRTAGIVTVVATGHGVQNGGSFALYGANEDSFNN